MINFGNVLLKYMHVNLSLSNSLINNTGCPFPILDIFGQG